MSSPPTSDNQTPVYLEANALCYWAAAAATPPDPRDYKIGSRVFDIIKNENYRVAISELCLAEFQNTVCSMERGDKPQFSAQWADRGIKNLMELIAAGSVEVLATPPRLIEDVMAMVRWVTRDHSRSFKAWDAGHLRSACLWARELGRTVTLVTNDSDFKKLYKVYPEYSKYVNLLDPEFD